MKTSSARHHTYSDANGPAHLAQLLSLAAYKRRDPAQMARVKAAAFTRMRDAVAPFVGTLAGKVVVDLGCGQWMANAKLFAASGARVVAVDPEVPPATAGGYVDFGRRLGLQRLAKTVATDLVLRRRFDHGLTLATGIDVGRARYTRIPSGAERLPLEDASVDIVVSDNVLEHLPDVPAAMAEIARVLRPGGVVCATIHPFTAFSGGHHPATIHHAGDGAFVPRIPAWDHLLDALHPSGVYLNRVRIRDYREILASHFETLRWDAANEGESFLTDEILGRLPGYTREELLVGKILFVGTPLASTAPSVAQ
jgi:SAM-dependent methyltransferase